tara:strand:- start:9962 stop:11200 length:1239 start_codon:yes stop_codon:yes gene_type:complete
LKTFVELFEAADSAQNLHMTHADEDLFERGKVGADFAITMLEDVLNTLESNNTSSENITVKWDGAPAVFCGTDPQDGKFFVGTKSVFNKNPKIYKTQKEINDGETGGKAAKLEYALKHLSSIGIPKDTVLQGDMMFTKGDQKYETIDGKRYITVHPNTLIYAFPVDSPVGKQIRNADLGIIFHTTYKGRGSLQNYSASFGAKIDKLRKDRSVWMDDAYFKNVSGTATFTSNESNELRKYITKAKRNVTSKFDNIIKIMDMIPSSAIGSHLKSYINSRIRLNKFDLSYNEYIKYVKTYWQTRVIDKVKTEKSKESKKAALKQLEIELDKIKNDIEKSFIFVEEVNKAKVMIIKKLSSLLSSKIFALHKNGDFIATAPEGFVAIGKNGQAVKLVDRLTFSRFNFSDDYIKGWQK